MADNMDLSTGETKKPGGSGKIKSILKKVSLLLILLSLLSTGVYFGYSYLVADKPGVVSKSELSEEILLFTFDIMPTIHADIVAISEEITFTDIEINRIEGIEKKFPDQKKITDTEKKLWEKNLLELNKFRVKHEKEIRDIYVSYRVNTETGLQLIEEKKEELNKTANELITPSKTLTDKLRAIEEAKGFWDKLKEKVF